MLRKALRLSSVARSAFSRPLASSLPCTSASPACALAEQQASRLTAPELKLLPLFRFHSTVAAAPGTAPAINPDLQAEIDHATGLEREELIGEAEGKPRFDLAPPTGPFGTVDDPALIESYFDERLVGCSGGIGEEEHDVVWFKLKKDVNHECSVCGQIFQLKVIGEGGLPGHHH